MEWLSSAPFLYVAGAVVVFLVLRIGLGVLRMFGTPIEPSGTPEEQVTEDVEEWDVRYRCIVCGTEMRLTRIAGRDDDFEPPKHCREEMSMVVEADTT